MNEFTGYRIAPHTKQFVYQDSHFSFEILGFHVAYNYEWHKDSCYFHFNVGRFFIQLIKPEKTNILNISAVIKDYKYFKLWLANPMATSDFD